jgi:hypothetical protein
MMMIIIIIIIIIISRYLLTCRLNSRSAYYKASIKYKYNTKIAQIHKANTKQTNKQTNKRKQYYRKRYIKVLGQ